MAAEYVVNVKELGAKVNALRQLNNSFKSAVGELESTEAQLNGMWEGEAREAFHAAFQSDKIQMGNFYNAVEVYAERLEDFAAKYAQAEAANTQTAVERKYK